MIDVSEIQFLTEEDFLKRIEQNNAAIRDLINDNSVLIKLYATDRKMTVTETAEYLKCPVQSIPKEIPCVHIGRNYLYSYADIQKFITKHRKVRKETK